MPHRGIKCPIMEVLDEVKLKVKNSDLTTRKLMNIIRRYHILYQIFYILSCLLQHGNPEQRLILTIR